MNLDFTIYLITVILSVLAGSLRWNQLFWADRLIIILNSITLVQEIVARSSELQAGSNLFTYYVYSPLELLLISLYFNLSVPKLRRHNIGLWAGIFGAVISVVSSFFLDSNQLFSFYILFEGVIIIFFCLYSFYAILMREDASPLPMAHFWIVLCLLFYWSLTFTGWGLYSMLENSPSPLLHTISNIRHISNILFYAGIAIIFFRYPKLIPSGG